MNPSSKSGIKFYAFSDPVQKHDLNISLFELWFIPRSSTQACTSQKALGLAWAGEAFGPSGIIYFCVDTSDPG
jgi:hypothetical protein